VEGTPPGRRGQCRIDPVNIVEYSELCEKFLFRIMCVVFAPDPLRSFYSGLRVVFIPDQVCNFYSGLCVQFFYSGLYVLLFRTIRVIFYGLCLNLLCWKGAETNKQKLVDAH
jgi:hypothetical protein